MIPCLRCGALFERRRGRRAYFCETHRAERRRDYEAARKRGIRALARDIRMDVDTYRASYDVATIDDTTEWLAGAHRETMFATVAEYAASVDDGDLWALVPDREPIRNALSPAGPDEGTSTGWTDVAETIEARARHIGEHPWFTANPHWAYELDDPDAAREYLDAA
jgi:hypothetical protein